MLDLEKQMTRFYARARTQPKRDGSMNRTEAAYAQHLELLKRTGEIARWDFQPEKLRLADRTFLEPDFRIVNNDGLIEWHDTKAAMSNGKPLIEDDAAVKMKVAAELHPFKFCIAFLPKGGNWIVEEV